MPVNCFTISTQDGDTLFSSPFPHGYPFVTTYIHSVELTPVVDEYRILQGGIWTWEEWVKSHNAGLPFAAPERGRFLVRPPWMIVQGGRRMEERIVYRVGDDKFGLNTWRLPPFEEIEVYRRFPMKRVFFEASVKKFRDAPVTDIIWDSQGPEALGWDLGQSPKFNIFLCVVYLALVALVTRVEKNVFLFLSTLFLPWSGVSFTGLDSRWWFAAISFAFIGARKRGFMCLAYTGITVVVLNRFMLTVGVPGALFDLESLSMILRLSSLVDGKLILAMAFFFIGLALSFAGSLVTAFSFSGFLAIVFMPFDAAVLLGVAPWAAALINPVVLFLSAVLLSRFLLKGAPLPEKARWAVPPACIAAGSCLLLFC